MDEETAQVDPAELCAALLANARATGLCQLRIGECVGIDTAHADDVDGGAAGARTCTRIRLADGASLACDSLVVALGPWSCKVEDWLDVPLPIEGVWSTSLIYESMQQAAHTHTSAEPAAPGPSTEPAAPGPSTEPAALFVEQDGRGCHLEVYPRPSGEVYVSGCGGSRIVGSEQLRADSVPPASANDPDQARVRAAERSLGELSALFVGRASDRQQACLRPCAPDGLPVIGRLPGLSNSYTACGHNTWGILWAPITGLAMSELLLDGESRSVNLRPFAPKRFDTLTYRTLSKQRGRQRAGVDVGEQW